MLITPAVRWFATLLAAGTLFAADAPVGRAPETPAQHDARMAWWREARFGLFIHWGVYATTGGAWKGKPAWTGGEWVMNGAEIPVKDYAALVPKFNPTAWNAQEVVRLAKEAGMRYVVLTAKHHDGFAMWPSAADPALSISATPLKRDPVGELAEACRAAGLKLGFYYSQSQDWLHPGGAAWGINGRTKDKPYWDPAQEGDFDHYLDTIAVPQIRELLTRYGSDVPAVLWWDTPYKMTPARAQRFRSLIAELRPDLITNNRLGGGFAGDTETPEQHIPPQGYPGRDWETCMTMNGSWGYKPSDTAWKRPADLVRNLIDIASKGGNYLLNIGPDGDGRVPPESVALLTAISQWMTVHAEAIHGTSATPFGAECGSFSPSAKDPKGKPVWTARWQWRCTRKPGRLYIHVLEWPASGRLLLPGLLTPVTALRLMADPARPLTATVTADGVELTLPGSAPDPIASVVAVDLAEPVPRVAKPAAATGPVPASETGGPAAH